MGRFAGWRNGFRAKYGPATGFIEEPREWNAGERVSFPKTLPSFSDAAQNGPANFTTSRGRWPGRANCSARLDLPQHSHALPDFSKIEFFMAVENGAPLLNSGTFVGLHRRKNKGFLVEGRPQLDLE